MPQFSDYADRFECIRFERRDGILEMALHRNGGPATWDGLDGGIHTQLGEAFRLVGRDPENKVVIFTGTGDSFVAGMEPSRGATEMTPETWDRIMQEGRDLLLHLLDIEVPVIGAVNGDAFIHAELPLLSDIVLAAEGSRFADKAHAGSGVAPTDGVHVIWPMLLGPNRGRHFLLTGAEIEADEAQRLGVVAEVVPLAELRDRAWELAEMLAQKPRLMLRYSRLAMVRELRRRLEADLGYGLALEGLAAMTLGR